MGSSASVPASPSDMLTQVKQRDRAFENVTVTQVRRTITKANEMTTTMDVDEPTLPRAYSDLPGCDLPKMIFEPQEPPPNWVEHLERLGFVAGIWARTYSEECDEWRAGHARRHSV